MTNNLASVQSILFRLDFSLGGRLDLHVYSHFKILVELMLASTFT